MKTKSGATLVEALIASMLLILGLSGFMWSFTVARQSAVMASEQMKAMHGARTIIETLCAYSYQDPILSIGSNKTLVGSQFMSNTYSITATPLYPNAKDVTVTVYWRIPAKAKIMSLSYSSTFAQALHYRK